MAKKKTQQSHHIRIIAGHWRGQKIKVIEQDDLRPTTDRVRETLFNWLSLSIINADCLDAFSGSGILSFETLSREAKSVVMVEKSRPAVNALKQNSAHLKASNISLEESDVIQYLSNTTNDFDVIFLDPPFAHPDLLIKALTLINNKRLIREKGVIYIEMSKHDLHMLDALNFEINWLKKKTAGQVCYALLSLDKS